jgi:Protein of unknown function (DUF551)
MSDVDDWLAKLDTKELENLTTPELTAAVRKLMLSPLVEVIEWIPVTERLPEIGPDPYACVSREVLVSCASEGERYAYVGHLFKHPDGKLVFCDSHDGEYYSGVTHWAELMKGPNAKHA